MIRHNHLALEDTLYQVGELEHLRRHSVRAARVAHGREDKEAELFWHVTAARCQQARRKVQGKLPVEHDEEWCPLKCAQAIKQLNYETMDGDLELFNELEELVDSVNSFVLGEDMTSCESCKADKLATQE